MLQLDAQVLLDSNANEDEDGFCMRRWIRNDKNSRRRVYEAFLRGLQGSSHSCRMSCSRASKTLSEKRAWKDWPMRVRKQKGKGVQCSARFKP